MQALLRATGTEPGAADTAANFIHLETCRGMSLCLGWGLGLKIAAKTPTEVLDPRNWLDLDQPLFPLSYGVEDPSRDIHGDWRVIVRYDHDREAPGGHDVTDAGLPPPPDIDRDGYEVRTERVTGPIPANDGFDAAEEGFLANAQRYVRRFERWHDISGRNDR